MTPLVLVHGFMGGSAQWAPQRPDLSDAFDLLALDLPGFGQNNHLQAIDTIGGFADWVIAQLRNRGILNYQLLGHSMGGMIAQEIARRDPCGVERLVLYATGAVGVLPGRFETIDESKTRARRDGSAKTARRIAATWFMDHEASPGFEDCAAIAQQANAEAIQAGLDAMQSWSGIDHLPAIGAKTLVIWGDRDRTYPWSQTHLLWDKIPQTNLAVVPACAHAVHLEKTAIFNRFVLDFLA